MLTRTRLVALAAATLLAAGVATPVPSAASASPVASLAERHRLESIRVAAFVDALDAEDSVSEDERAYGPYDGLVSLPAMFLAWWMRRQVMRGVRRLLGRGLARMFGDVALPSAMRTDEFGASDKSAMSSALEERIQHVKPESAYDSPAHVVAAPAIGPGRSFGRRGVR